MDLNQVSLIGYVSKTPEHKSLDNDTGVTRVHVATNYSWKDAQSGDRKEKVNFHTIIAWNNLANIINKYVKKGDRVYVEGRIDYRNFVSKDGQPKYVTDIVADKMIMLTAPKQRQPKDEVSTDAADPNAVPFIELAD